MTAGYFYPGLPSIKNIPGYCPGGILLSSTVKHIIEQNNIDTLVIKELDLSQGVQDGMSYKKRYSGLVHYN